MFRLVYTAYTHEGNVRKNNEDNFLVNRKYKKDISQNRLLINGRARGDRLLAAVCDGMGGQDYGELASLTAVKKLADMRRQEPHLLRDNRKGYVDTVNLEICKLMREKNARMGTTLAALEFSGDFVVAVNLGDSRIYSLHDGILDQISEDHSTVRQLIRMGMITEEQALSHSRRHEITQYLGIFPEEMLLEPAVAERRPLRLGDKYLLCSDGLTDELSNEQIREILAESGNPNDAAKRLVEKALEKKGNDNITVVVIEIVKGLLG